MIRLTIEIQEDPEEQLEITARIPVDDSKGYKLPPSPEEMILANHLLRAIEKALKHLKTERSHDAFSMRIPKLGKP